MDVLESLHIDDLPEQQTRIAHLLDQQESELNLGVDCCASCGSAERSVPCPHCHRIWYCSEACRHTDAHVVLEDDGEPALGHSAVICQLLKAVSVDETVLEGTCQDVAAQQRIRSEHESYLATLSGALKLDYFETLLLTQSRITIHVVGASDDAELVCTFSEYSEALADLPSQIHLVFVGPELTPPKESPIFEKLQVTCLEGLYHELDSDELGTPDLVVLFQPGLTVPDYHWTSALEKIPDGCYLLLTSNTEMEVLSELQYLLELDKLQSLPNGLADILEVDCHHGGLFTVNPYAGSRVRQNTNLANDVYVKNRWIFCGKFGSLRAPPKASSAPKKLKSIV